MDDSNKKQGDSEGSVDRGKKGTPISRRDMLKMAGVGGMGLLIGSVGIGGVLAGTQKGFSSRVGTTNEASDRIPFYGTNQAGILTASQNFLCFASFDLSTTQLAEVVELFKAWTSASALMCSGEPVGTENTNPKHPPADTGEAVGLSASKTTITFGVSPSFLIPVLDYPPKNRTDLQICRGSKGIIFARNGVGETLACRSVPTIFRSLFMLFVILLVSPEVKLYCAGRKRDFKGLEQPVTRTIPREICLASKMGLAIRM